MLVLIKNNLNYLKYSILKSFFKEYSRFFKIFFSKHVIMERLSFEEENIFKGIKNLIRIKRKRTKLHCN